MKIIAIPTNDNFKQAASVRLRYLNFLNHCGLPWERYRGSLDGTILYVEKKSSPQVIEIARKAKKHGLRVVFDLNDGLGYRDKDPKKRNDKAMCEVAHAITCNSQERADILKKLTGKDVYVVPDGIDYNIKPTDRVKLNARVSVLCTFGHFKQMKISASVLNSTRGFYITDRVVSGFRWKFKPWKYDVFVKKISKADVCFLIHSKTEASKLKSNNRLLVTMALGLPTMVSDSYVYRNIVTEIGTTEMIFALGQGDINDLKFRQRISDMCYEYTWENYSPAVIGKRFGEVMESI